MLRTSNLSTSSHQKHRPTLLCICSLKNASPPRHSDGHLCRGGLSPYLAGLASNSLLGSSFSSLGVYLWLCSSNEIFLGRALSALNSSRQVFAHTHLPNILTDHGREDVQHTIASAAAIVTGLVWDKAFESLTATPKSVLGSYWVHGWGHIRVIRAF